MGSRQIQDTAVLPVAVLPVDVRKIGRVTAIPRRNDFLDELEIQLDPDSADAANLRRAAEQLNHSNIPVAFPTETVYGLGADATRSAAVNGIYGAKQRPADNPLIVHFSSLKQLRGYLGPSQYHKPPETSGHMHRGYDEWDPIPPIYKPLIAKSWPGPLTIILPLPHSSDLAPEVTAGLQTFGARIPRNVLALALIQLAGVPLAAPSANASTKPSPTTAEHVAYDLDGRIETIIDGGPCDVGVESTVVDGLSDPPLILRPGGMSIAQLRSCHGWENTQIGYKNVSEAESQPKAPGMKYRHYSPKATVVLYEVGKSAPSLSEICGYLGSSQKLGIITTKRWKIDPTSMSAVIQQREANVSAPNLHRHDSIRSGFAGMLKTLQSTPDARTAMKAHTVQYNASPLQVLEIALGANTADVARGIFSALRELDREDVDAIFVEGIDECEGDTAVAVMNRCRNAAEINVAG